MTVMWLSFTGVACAAAALAAVHVATTVMPAAARRGRVMRACGYLAGLGLVLAIAGALSW
jgi:hypothetical protein